MIAFYLCTMKNASIKKLYDQNTQTEKSCKRKKKQFGWSLYSPCVFGLKIPSQFLIYYLLYVFIRSSHLNVLFRIGVLKICSKFTGEHPYESVISLKLLCNFIEIALRHGCSPVNLLYICCIPLVFPVFSGWIKWEHWPEMG